MIAGVLACVGASGPAQAQQPEVITLAAAVRTALARNNRIVNERDTVEQAALARHAATSLFRPKLVPNVQGSVGQTEASNQTYRLDFLQRTTFGTEVRAGFGASSALIPSVTDPLGGDVRFYNADTNVTIVQPLMRGLGKSVARRALTSAEVRHQDAMVSLARAEQLLSVEVASTYFRVIQQRSLRDVAEKSLERSEQLLRVADAKMQAGLVSQLDVLRARQLVAESRLQLGDATYAVDSARDELATLMGWSTDRAFEVVGDIPATDAPPSLEGAMATARERRADLARARSSVSEAERTAGYFRNQLLPQVDLSVGLTRRETATSLADSVRAGRFHLSTFFTISMPIDRTPQLVEYQNALIDRDRRRRDADLLEQAVADEVKRYAREQRRLADVLAAAEASVDLARQEVEIAGFRYARGLSNSLDVISAETGLLAAEGRLVMVRAEAAVTRLRLRAVMGVLDPVMDFASDSPRETTTLAMRTGGRP